MVLIALAWGGYRGILYHYFGQPQYTGGRSSSSSSSRRSRGGSSSSSSSRSRSRSSRSSRGGGGGGGGALHVRMIYSVYTRTY